MDSINTSGRALVDHWKYASAKGLMNSNTANALRVACTKVLEVVDGWQSLDVRALNVEDVYRRFVNKRSKDFTPESLETYRRRFTLAVKEFLQYTEDPTSWKSPSNKRSVRKSKVAADENGSDATVSPTMRAPALPISVGGLVEYPFPLREGLFAYLKLPADLKKAEVKRLVAYLDTLAVDIDQAV
jgi:hypothetical protein